MMGAVWRIGRACEKVLPPSFDEVNMMSSSWLQIAYSVPSGPTVPSKPSAAPLSSRGNPGCASISTGADQVFPSSVDRETTICESVIRHRVHPTYRLPANLLFELSATM